MCVLVYVCVFLVCLCVCFLYLYMCACVYIYTSIAAGFAVFIGTQIGIKSMELSPFKLDMQVILELLTQFGT